jgi:predicted metal-dependent HD superfamily phosphohydrolase
MENLLNTSWRRLWSGLGASDDGTAFQDALLQRYSEPWRKYHTIQHLSECIATFECAAYLAVRPAEVEAALWFHDAVYEMHRADNEEQSALLAQRVLSEAGVASEVTSRVVRLILSTKHSAVPSEPDDRLLADVDLSILGASEQRFAEYERQIRQEYWFVPEAVFQQKRRAVLGSFLARPRIYSTQHFHSLLEQRARLNVTRAVGENGPNPSLE